MNEENFKKGVQDLKNVSMSVAERSHILENLKTYIQKTARRPETKSPFWSYFTGEKMLAIAVCFVLFFFTGYGTISKAARSLPGDGLYFLKTHIEEPLLSALTPSAVQKAKLEVRKVSERISEAESLSNEGKLDDQKKVLIEERFNKHLEVFEGIEKREERASSTATTTTQIKKERKELESNIKAHKKVIDRILEKRERVESEKSKAKSQ